MDETRNRRHAKTRQLTATRAGRETASAFEELICDAARRLLLRARGFEPFDFAREQRDALSELFDRQQREILPDLVDKFLFRLVLVLVRSHLVHALSLKIIAIARPVVTFGGTV